MILRDLTLHNQEEQKEGYIQTPQDDDEESRLINDKCNVDQELDDYLKPITYQQRQIKNKTLVPSKKKYFEDVPQNNGQIIQGFEEDNDNSLSIAEKMIKLDLLLMGFDMKTVHNLLKFENVTDTNQGVDFLIKGPNGYTHKYQLDIFSQKCAICQEVAIEHQDEKTRLSELRMQILNVNQNIAYHIVANTNLNDNPITYLQQRRSIPPINQRQVSRQSIDLQNFGAHFHLPSQEFKPAPIEPVQRAQPIDFGGVMCEICYMNYMETDMYGIICNHKFCLNCLYDYLEFNVTNGQVMKVKCPQNTCKEEFTREDIRKFGSQEIYMKYLKFKENIDVNLNPNLKWCPKPNCNHYIQKNKKSRKVKCECGMEICFDCGIEWHGKIKCKEAMDKEFFGWAANNGNISNCPKCKVRLEKIAGCNHMTCRQCGYSWCWLCGKKYTSNHYSIINVFGCPGQQYFTYHRIWVILLNILIFAGIPLIILLAPPVYLIGKYFDNYDDDFISRILCCVKCIDRTCSNCFCQILVAIFVLPIVISIGLLVGAIALAILIVPAYIFQLYRILKLVFYRCRCCLK
ncbi:ibr domain containing protein [Stylonychia lemnae]|uniref:RBR-type E3 ubiquitin transferase n=1 Tax=Stylonychia lemnae TaxID=5949 RepID=A0A078AXA0_STYLE|nr:ibr domain containing protein [Stylonychia lemnae]|eukprot:CDW86799.1 ibr domain containing protein [Stylonychia lemnae]